eukprot:g426.t1
MVSMLNQKGANYHKIYHRIYLIMPTSSQESIKNSPFRRHKQDQVFTELSPEVLDHVVERVHDDAERKKHSLIIIDDQTVFLKDLDIQRQLQHLQNNKRHLRCSTWCLTQSYISMPLSIRRLCTHLIMWRQHNKKDFESLFGELVHLEKSVYEDMMEVVYRNKHDFLFVDVQNAKFYRNFNSLEITDE